MSSQSDGSVSSVLTVARPILHLDGKLHEEATAKSRAGDRLVFLDTKTARLLCEHRQAQMAAPPGSWQDHDLVFCQPDAPVHEPVHGRGPIPPSCHCA